MTEWIDVLVYAAFMLVLWVGIPAWSARFTRPMLEDRNAEWVAAHPEVAGRLTRNRWYVWCSWALGAVSIAVLVAAQTDAWPRALSAPAFEAEHWMVLSDVHTALVLIWLAYAVAGGTLFTRWLRTHVPLAERRRASLEPRSIDTFVPGGIRIAVYTAVGLHLVAWLFVGVLRIHSTPGASFWGMAIAQFVLGAIFLFIVRTIVLRRPNAMDRIFGPGFRRAEVRTRSWRSCCRC